jgi:FkbM family methyltransferase
MLTRTLTTSQKDTIDITSDDEIIIEWFSRPSETHTDIIIDQINEGMYDRFFTGRKDMTVIDCGANIGLWTVYAHDSCQKIVAVEPAPHNVYILQQFTQGFDNIAIDQSALSSEDGTIEMNIHSSPTCNSIVYESDTDVAIDVETKTIATIMKQHNLEYVDFVKCDIEGAEILAFSDETLAPVKDLVGSWLIECHKTDGASWPGNLEANRISIRAILEKAGYQTEAIVHDQIYAWK